MPEVDAMASHGRADTIVGMTSSASRVVLGLSFLLLGGCGSDGDGGAPEAPTWFADVQPLMAAQCASCHGATPISDAVSDFRLDRYVKNDDSTFDAYDYRELIVAHAVDRLEPAMPLGILLTTMRIAHLIQKFINVCKSRLGDIANNWFHNAVYYRSKKVTVGLSEQREIKLVAFQSAL